MQLLGGDFSLGKTLITLGLGLAAVGVLVLLFDKLGVSLGRLPGDIRIEGKRGGFYFPLVTSIVVSVVLSVLLNLLGKK